MKRPSLLTSSENGPEKGQVVGVRVARRRGTRGRGEILFRFPEELSVRLL